MLSAMIDEVHARFGDRNPRMSPRPIKKPSDALR